VCGPPCDEKNSFNPFFILKNPKHSISKPFGFSEQYDGILLMLHPRPLMDCPILAYFHPQPFVYGLPRQDFMRLNNICLQSHSFTPAGSPQQFCMRCHVSFLNLSYSSVLKLSNGLLLTCCYFCSCRPTGSFPEIKQCLCHEHFNPSCFSSKNEQPGIINTLYFSKPGKTNFQLDIQGASTSLVQFIWSGPRAKNYTL